MSNNITNIYNDFSKAPELTVYIFKQRTKELLYESRKLSEKIKETNMFDIMVSCEEANKNTEIKCLKDKLYEFHSLMLNFMKEYQMESDTIMKILCDDIYIAYKNIGTSVCSIFTSEIQDTCYYSSIVELEYSCSQSLEMPKLTRQTNIGVPKQYENNIELGNICNSDSFVSLINGVETP